MQTVSFAGSNYSIPNTRGDRPWSGLSDFVIAAASKAINTAGGNFTLLADINFGASFGLVSAYFTSRTASAASAGAVRLAKTDVISWRNNAGGADIDLSKNTSNELLWNGSRIILAGGGLIVNADVSASAAIALTKLASSSAYYWYIAGATGVLTPISVGASKAIATDANGSPVAATTTSTELNFVAGVTSAIQTQINSKQASGSYITSLTGGVTASGPGAAAATVVTNANLTGPITSVGNATAIASQTGTGTKFVVDNTPTLVTPILGAATATSITFSPTTSGIVGTTTNDNAAAGKVGEFVSSAVGFTNMPSSTTYGDLTSISLTAGDWDVSVIGTANANGATITQVVIGISATSGNSGTGLVNGDNVGVIGYSFSGGSQSTVSIPPFRISLASTTTYYFKYNGSYSVATAQMAGRISARRVR